MNFWASECQRLPESLTIYVPDGKLLTEKSTRLGPSTTSIDFSITILPVISMTVIVVTSLVGANTLR